MEASRAKPGVLCRAVRELQQCIAPLMTINGDNVLEASLLRPVEEESEPSPTPEEETALLTRGDELSGAPGPTPQHAKDPKLIELAKQTATPVTATEPHHHPSLRRGKSWEGINVDPSNTSQWVSIYLKKDRWLPECWEEFHPQTHSADRCCNDTLAKYMAHQQAVAFHLPTTQKEVHGTWLAPSSLSELKREEYLGPKDPPANLGLLGGSKRRNHHTGCHTSAVCHMGQSPSRHILWSHPRAL